MVPIILYRHIQQRLRIKTVEHLAEQFSASGVKDKENIKMKQEYDEDVRHQLEESELRSRERQQKLLEQREREEEEKKRREEEIKKVCID